ncbi:hypothetical protein, partial [Streptomyces sp. NPDC058861]|uniref:hypothetical protein n=1 Tax=Streptomyces sp. NPDC058861 TaxID=3346653 RepID=UPI00369B1D41
MTTALETPATPVVPARKVWSALHTHFRPHRAAVACGAVLALIGGGGRGGPPARARARAGA